MKLSFGGMKILILKRDPLNHMVNSILYLIFKWPNFKIKISKSVEITNKVSGLLIIWSYEALFKINIFILCKWHLHWIQNFTDMATFKQHFCFVLPIIPFKKNQILVINHHMAIWLNGAFFRINIYIPCKWQLCWTFLDKISSDN